MESPRQALADRSVRELLDAVGARTPAPGGGTAAALAGALGAGLVEMAARFTPGREHIVSEASALRARLLEMGERELGAYEPVLEIGRASCRERV